MSSPPARSPTVTTRVSPPRRLNSGRQQRNAGSSTSSRRSLHGLRRTRTMPASMPSPIPRLSASKMMVTPRLSKIFDFGLMGDDTSTSATSFLSLSLSNHSSHGNGSHNSSCLLRTAGTRPTEICVHDFDDFASKVLPEYVQDKALATMLQYGVREYLLPGEVTQDTLQEIELSLASIFESNPSLPGNIVAELHSYRGLVHLQRENASAAAIESFTRALWLYSHMDKSSRSVDATTEAEGSQRMWEIALTEHRLGVAYGRSGKYLKAIDQMEHAIKSYNKAGVGISEACYVAAKEDMHEFQEAHQISLVRSSGRPIRSSLLRRTKSYESGRSHPLSSAIAKLIPDEVKVELEREMERQDSFSY